MICVMYVLHMMHDMSIAFSESEGANKVWICGAYGTMMHGMYDTRCVCGVFVVCMWCVCQGVYM